MADAVSLLAAQIQLILKARRYELGISQSTLAAQLGTPKCQINRWENLTVTPSGMSLLRWARALDMRLLCVPIEVRARRRQRQPEATDLPLIKTRRGYSRKWFSYYKTSGAA